MNLADIEKAELECAVVTNGKFNLLGVANGSYSPGDEVLTYLEDTDDINDMLLRSNISSVICSRAIASEILTRFPGGVCTAADPRGVFFKYHNYLGSKTDFYLSEFRSDVHDSAFVHSSAEVAAKNVRIGKNCRIGANVVVRENTQIGDNVVVHDGSVVGADGFNYFDQGGAARAAVNYGGVSIMDDADIHANTTIERGLFRGATVIGRGAKVGGMTYIGHDVNIGPGCKIAVGVIIAPYAAVGNGSFIDTGARIGRMACVGDGCEIASAAVVNGKIPDNLRFPTELQNSRSAAYRFEREFWNSAR
ncbi:MAG: hypothetical protein LBT34_03195 [Clostridiales Family XIII bacterium]|jgi:UDP-3-O-[3-hydroxymyristoyl] glucosamine N-acyltransferase|nr:hypothetical protein [Clostridiales Family XIII bacterium]